MLALLAAMLVVSVGAHGMSSVGQLVSGPNMPPELRGPAASTPTPTTALVPRRAVPVHRGRFLGHARSRVLVASAKGPGRSSAARMAGRPSLRGVSGSPVRALPGKAPSSAPTAAPPTPTALSTAPSALSTAPSTTRHLLGGTRRGVHQLVSQLPGPAGPLAAQTIDSAVNEVDSIIHLPH